MTYLENEKQHEQIITIMCWAIIFDHFEIEDEMCTPQFCVRVFINVLTWSISPLYKKKKKKRKPRIRNYFRIISYKHEIHPLKLFHPNAPQKHSY